MTTKLKNQILIAVAFSVAALFTVCTQAAEWGSLKGRFVVDGEAPEVTPLNVDKDAFCIENKPENNTLVVGDNGELANVVIYVRVPRRGKVDVHPDYEASKDEPVTLDNKGCEFVPHVALVRAGQPFIIKNSDPTGHNTNARLVANGSFNVLIAEGQENKMTFSKAEPMPMPVNCNIHPFMSGHVLIQEHPYMAASAADGTFEIKNLPVGEHEFQLWHEKVGYLKDISVEGEKTNRQGRIDLTIKAGETLDLGDVKVPATALK